MIVLKISPQQECSQCHRPGCWEVVKIVNVGLNTILKVIKSLSEGRKQMNAAVWIKKKMAKAFSSCAHIQTYLRCVKHPRALATG